MELKKAIEVLNKLEFEDYEYTYNGLYHNIDTILIKQAIDTVLEELNNRISKDDLKNILRKVQDYQLNYKDTVLFNIIMQEIFGEKEWTNLENKE